MSIHIGAAQGAIAEVVLLPGDPLRARFIAEHFLQNVVCYNEVRGMLGFTGLYKGQRVSVQGTGMGVPSIAIYAQELIEHYGVKKLVRVGTCGSMQEQVRVRDVILAQTASTDSAHNRLRFDHIDYAPAADFPLLYKAYNRAVELGLSVHVGGVYTADLFYNDQPEIMKRLMAYGVLGVEMETSVLYTLAAKFAVQALSILTVSDHLITGEETTAQERQQTFLQMMELALETVLATD